MDEQTLNQVKDAFLPLGREILSGLKSSDSKWELLEERLDHYQAQSKEQFANLKSQTEERYATLSQKCQNIATGFNNLRCGDNEKDISAWRIELESLKKTVELNTRQDDACREHGGEIKTMRLEMKQNRKEIDTLTAAQDEQRKWLRNIVAGVIITALGTVIAAILLMKIGLK